MQTLLLTSMVQSVAALRHMHHTFIVPPTPAVGDVAVRLDAVVRVTRLECAQHAPWSRIDGGRQGGYIGSANISARARARRWCMCVEQGGSKDDAKVRTMATRPAAARCATDTVRSLQQLSCHQSWATAYPGANLYFADVLQRVATRSSAWGPLRLAGTVKSEGARACGPAPRPHVRNRGDQMNGLCLL